MDNFWIPIEFADQATKMGIDNAVAACYETHKFTVETLNDYFIDHAETYPYSNFRVELNIFLKKYRNVFQTQRYSLQKAAELTFPYFNQNKRFEGDRFMPVKPINEMEYNSIQIKTRHIWHKYMALNSLITTVYGTIYLDDRWTSILAQQAREQEIAFDSVPNLWHSIVIETEPIARIRFNIHAPHSKFKKKLETYANV